MTLKYNILISKFTKCEISNCRARTPYAFRWVFKDILDERNFIPRYLDPEYPGEDKIDCRGYALSMFDTEEQAIGRLLYLLKGKGKLYEKLGTHTAKGVLTIHDGISNDSSDHPHGHFSFFEFKDIALSTKFNLSKQIIYN